MNLIENEEANRKNKNTKLVMLAIIVLIVFLIGVSCYLVYMINDIQQNTLKLSIDNKNTNFNDNLFVIENGKLYVAIKQFGQLMGYTPYNGDYKNHRYYESTTDCYISSPNEIASYSLNSDEMYKKVTTNEDYEYFDLEEPVKLIDGELYVIEEGIEIGTNSIIEYNQSANQITVFSLDYLITFYASKFPNAEFIEEETDFNNRKALRYGMVVVKNEEEHFGVYATNGTEIIGTKYAGLSFKEDSQEYTVTTDEGTMGILSANGATKIEPNYSEIKQISKELNYYLVCNNEKYGVINHNGNVVVHLEYDDIGINESRFNSNGLDSPYIFFDNCIPVQQAGKWGLFGINGEVILPVQFDEMGCLLGTQASEIGNNVIVIPQYEAIVVGKEDKYGIISASGKVYVPMILDSVYSQTVSGEDKYYMSFTLPLEETDDTPPTQYTYDVDQYFAEHVIETPQRPEINQNTIVTPNANTTVDTNTEVDANEIIGNETVINEVSTNGINTNGINNGTTNTVTTNGTTNSVDTNSVETSGNPTN